MSQRVFTVMFTLMFVMMFMMTCMMMCITVYAFSQPMPVNSEPIPEIVEEPVTEEPEPVEEVLEEVGNPIDIPEVAEIIEPIEAAEEEPEKIEVKDVMDLTRISDKTPEELAEYMHPETRHLANDVVRICKEQGVNAEFIAAVMRYERRPDLCNWFGWYGSKGLVRFDSDIECLEIVIPKIRKNYLEPDGCYYNGATVEGVSIFYNDTDHWRNSIKAEMEKMV